MAEDEDKSLNQSAAHVLAEAAQCPVDYGAYNMIQADIYGKTGVPEDVLTSCCLGLLRLMPDDYMIELLAYARNRAGHLIDLAGIDKVQDLEFWPWLRDGGIPDAIATLDSNLRPNPLKIVIEVKHGALKSGGDGDDDQLARYYRSAVRQHQGYQISLIYLTHHRDMPVDDLDASLKHLTDNAKIYWLSWFAVAKWCADKLYRQDLSMPKAEIRILCTLSNYLSIKGYLRFNELNTLSHDVRIEPLYTQNYISRDITFRSSVTLLYKHFYINLQNVSSIPIIFKHQGGQQ